MRPLNDLSLPLMENFSAKGRRNQRKKEYSAFLKGQSTKGKRQKSMTDVSQAKVITDGSYVWLKPSKQPLSGTDATALIEVGLESPSHQGCGPRKQSEQRSRSFQEQHNLEPGSSVEELHLLAKRHASQDYRLQEPRLAISSQKSRSTASKDDPPVATGLMIGTAEDDLVRQQKKDQYRQELLDQIAEQQRNKKREKELRLMVAMTGPTDPCMLPNHFSQFSTVCQEHNGSRRQVPNRLGLDTQHSAKKPLPVMEESSPQESHSVTFPSPVLKYSTTLPPLAGSKVAGLVGDGHSSHNEDIHKSLSSTLVAPPRVLAAPPPIPFTFVDSYGAPFSNAYYYYGPRNPMAPSWNARLAPTLAHGEPAEGAVYPVTHLDHMPRPAQPTLLGHTQPPAQAIDQTGPAPSGMGIGAIPGGTPNKSNYQEVLKQQIREREELRKHEEVERQRHEAKLAREMEVYNPWGRGGGGAPLRDSQGNLVADLKQMHKFNKEVCLNPSSQDKQAALLIAGATPTPNMKDRPPSSHRNSVVSSTQTSSLAPGNVFTEPSVRQQLHDRERYKDDLLKQIEEKRRKEAEERERIRLQEEEDEKRVAKEQAKIRKEYEEEQEKRRRKEMEMMQQAEAWRKQREEKREEKKCEEREHEEENEEENKEEDEKKHQEAEKTKMEEEDKHQGEASTLQTERERPAHVEKQKHRESPPLDAKGRKELATERPPRKPSADSQRTPSAVSVSSQCMSGENAKNGQKKKKREEEWRQQERDKEEKRQREVLKLQCEMERPAQVQEEQHREHSPPVPALIKKLALGLTSTSPSVDSYRPPSAVFENTKNGQKKKKKKHEEDWCQQERHKREKRNREVLKLQCEMERPARVEEEQRRELSPLVPAPKKKLGPELTSRPLFTESHQRPSAVSKGSLCPPQSPEDPSNRNPVRATRLQQTRDNTGIAGLGGVHPGRDAGPSQEEYRAMTSHLSVLRRLLRNQQRLLEEELLQTEEEEGDVSHPIRCRKCFHMDMFHMGRPVAVRKTPRKAPETTNLQNVLDFNKLKDKDSESREEVHCLDPVSSTNDQNPDIQQKALIRKENRRVDRLRKMLSADEFLYDDGKMKTSTRDLVKDPLLTSASAFFDSNMDVTLDPSDPEEGTSKPLARQQQKLGYWEPAGQSDFDSLHCQASLHKEHKKQRMRRLQELRDHGWLDELDMSTENRDGPNTDMRTYLDRVARNPCLRPGSSDHLRQITTCHTDRQPSRNWKPDW
ncbi:centrosome and spindle pole associated protein 1-like isoform X1 [Scleropages formosus]|uniref:centrosome and spindle pole associated protein 1-like isoform X1 n=1 Tax=Scleropages formosus TaxID=113540 RepID=UPI0010FA6BB5|nr:centrosome and spindle pole associated protein 1-like isoform X1 [Scleropages formosus]XP_018609445.2 centrosome and spindle pole associated protein 1-like isoform X1 [Scleropages formosus]